MAGLITPDELGITLPHEHLLCDTSPWATISDEATKRRLFESPVSISILGQLRRDPYACKDNLKLLDIDLAIRELLHFRQAGGKSLVELTLEGIGRDPTALRRISLETGVNIIAGCGFYIDSSHPPLIRSMNVEQIAEEITKDITLGIGGSGIKAGIIGEIGTGWPITPNEENVLRAAAKAHHQTGAAINVHPFPYGEFSHPCSPHPS